jgi:hypothetical protein
MVDAIRRIQPLIKRACIHAGSNPVLTTMERCLRGLKEQFAKLSYV